jgi:hypothetical protein
MDFFELNLGKVLSESSLTPLNFYFEDKMQYWKLRSEFVELQISSTPLKEPFVGYDSKLMKFTTVEKKISVACVFLKWGSQVAIYSHKEVREIVFEEYVYAGLRIFLIKEDGILQFSEHHSIQYKSGRLCIVSNKKPA